jgi:glycosyltransferase involved in cell wall biosynthesis
LVCYRCPSSFLYLKGERLVPRDRAKGPATHQGVTCLLVTLPVPERVTYAKRSIADFCAQTLAAKALVVVMNGGLASARDELRAHVAALGRNEITIVEPDGQLNLGQLRNISLDVAATDIVCQWDDDDLYHPRRLETQLALLEAKGSDAVYLQDVMQYYPESCALYWTNWRATPSAGHPGTLMARRSAGFRYPIAGGSARLGEDSIVAGSLIERGRVGYVTGMAHLYVYVSHGANSWDQSHHDMLRDRLAISNALLRRREPQLREGLAPYGFAPGTLTVTGGNGAAFVL